jgi:type IV secretory pathway VirB4 component
MSVRSAKRPAHRATTRHAQAIYPFLASGGLGGQGIFVGRDSSGGAFVYDAWVLYQRDELKDANMIIFGRLGQGKSALIKTMIWRNLLFGRRAFVLDIKREYGPLCDLAGVTAIALEPGGAVRLNPLASRPEEHAQLQLLRAVAQTTVGGQLTQEEAGALRESLRVVRQRGSREPTIPE